MSELLVLFISAHASLVSIHITLIILFLCHVILYFTRQCYYNECFFCIYAINWEQIGRLTTQAAQVRDTRLTRARGIYNLMINASDAVRT